MPKPFNFYYLNEPVIPEEAERAIRGFIRNVKMGQPVPPELLKFIANGLEKQYQEGKVSNWTGKKSGRPTVFDDDYLNMFTWYKFHFDKNFCNEPKTTGNGRYSKIADFFKRVIMDSHSTNSKFSEVHLAASLSNKTNGIYDLDSEESVKRAVKKFEKNGLQNMEVFPFRIHNEKTLLTFCLVILRLSHEEANKHSIEIYNYWVNCKNHEKGQK